MRLDTCANRTVVNQEFVNKHQIATYQSGAKVIKMDNDTTIQMKRETLPFYIKLSSVKYEATKLVMLDLIYNQIAYMDWLQKTKSLFKWDISIMLSCAAD